MFPELGIRVSTDDIQSENIIENKLKSRSSRPCF